MSADRQLLFGVYFDALRGVDYVVDVLTKAKKIERANDEALVNIAWQEPDVHAIRFINPFSAVAA
ncbi:MAG: hypothetical protein IIC53_08915, partial [Proteobacteria bacterium]|nr:hypothetical protein [Pseudomonadota bacterium]